MQLNFHIKALLVPLILKVYSSIFGQEGAQKQENKPTDILTQPYTKYCMQVI